MTDSDWPAYYAVTVNRPPWRTLLEAARLFGLEGDARSMPRLAVDLGCGAGRDARELLRQGWRVLAVDRETAALESLVSATPPADRPRLVARCVDLASYHIPRCDLVNASVSLPFLAPGAFAQTWERLVTGLEPGNRFAGMLFGDRDDAAPDPSMTCPSPDAIRALFDKFEVEFWAEKEEDGQTALGDAHHLHVIEVVARRI